MEAQVGDEVILHGRTVGAAARVAMVVGVHGPDGPYRVQFLDGTETLLFPGPDAEIRPAGPSAGRLPNRSARRPG